MFNTGNANEWEKLPRREREERMTEACLLFLLSCSLVNCPHRRHFLSRIVDALHRRDGTSADN